MNGMLAKGIGGMRFPLFRCALWGLAFIVAVSLSGCGKKMIPHTLVEKYEKLNIKTIAVLPVVDETGNREAGPILRQRIMESLYFKGHSKMPASVIDEKTGLFFKNVKVPKSDMLPPVTLGPFSEEMPYCTAR